MKLGNLIFFDRNWEITGPHSIIYIQNKKKIKKSESVTQKGVFVQHRHAYTSIVLLKTMGAFMYMEKNPLV